MFITKIDSRKVTLSAHLALGRVFSGPREDFCLAIGMLGNSPESRLRCSPRTGDTQVVSVLPDLAQVVEFFFPYSN